MISRKSEQVFGSERNGAPLPRTSEERESYDDRLNRILAAATEAFARVGYQKASMRLISRESGVSLSGLYYYFSGKEKMLFVIQFRTFSSLLSNVREKLHDVEDPIEQLQVMVRTHVGYFAANMAALKVCSHELDSLDGSVYEDMRRLRYEYYRMARSIVGQMIDRHTPGRTLDHHVATMSLFGTLNWLYRWYDPKGGRSPNVLANQLAEQFLQGLLGATGQNGQDA